MQPSKTHTTLQLEKKNVEEQTSVSIQLCDETANHSVFLSDSSASRNAQHRRCRYAHQTINHTARQKEPFTDVIRLARVLFLHFSIDIL